MLYIVKEIQVKNHNEVITSHLSDGTQMMNVGKDVEKREPSYTVNGNVNWCNHCEKQYRVSSKN